MPSIYVKCAGAARELLADPSKRIVTNGPDGIFTELDIIFRAQRGETWTEEENREATKAVSGLMTTMFRSDQAVRFGPVHPPDLEEPDYMRIATKIVYAAPDGPAVISTPNGDFHRLTNDQDTISRAGRRYGSARDDLEPWAGQGEVPTGNTAEQREIVRLKAENTSLWVQLQEERTENARLRAHAAQVITREDLRNEIEGILSAREDPGREQAA